DASDLPDRIAEHVLEDHRAALNDWQPCECFETACSRKMLLRGWRDIDYVQILLRLKGIVAGTPAKEIDRFVMGDAEKPGLRLGNLSLAGECRHCLGQRLLQDILAVDDRPRHAGAVAMELRSQLADQPLERRPVAR